MQADEGVELLEREMSASVEELARGLESAFPGAVAGGPQEYRVQQGALCLEISLHPGPDRVIGGLRLPTLGVRIRCSGGGAGDRARLLARLDLATHRGGG